MRLFANFKNGMTLLNLRPDCKHGKVKTNMFKIKERDPNKKLHNNYRLGPAHEVVMS